MTEAQPHGPADDHTPAQIQPQGLADYLDVLSKAVFQSGISWKVVEAKWAGTRAAFRGFDPPEVAALTPDELDALMADTRIIRHRRKVEAVVQNAAQMLELDARPGGFRAYLRSHGGFEATVADLRRRFKYLGDTGAYYFLYVVGEPVPSYDEWCASRGREHHTAAP
jgi:3-methyladenine DNA glycosylase Tag